MPHVHSFCNSSIVGSPILFAVALVSRCCIERIRIDCSYIRIEYLAKLSVNFIVGVFLCGNDRFRLSIKNCWAVFLVSDLFSSLRSFTVFNWAFFFFSSDPSMDPRNPHQSLRSDGLGFGRAINLSRRVFLRPGDVTRLASYYRP